MLVRRTLATLVLVAGCSDPGPPELGARAYVGDQLEVWTSEGVTACGGSFEALDRHAALLSEYAAERGVVTRDERFRYYWLTRDELADTPCPNATACAVGSKTIYVPSYSTHEVVHAELAANSSSFANEGLADLLGDGYFGQVPNEGSIPDLIDETRGETLARTRYQEAASFSAALRDLYPEEYLAALRSTRYGDDFAAFEARMRRADVDLDAVLDLYQSRTGCWMDSIRIALLECATEPTPWDRATGWTATGRVDCTDSQTLGPTGDLMWTIRTVDVAQAGRYTVWFEAERGTYSRMVGCDAPWCGSKSNNPGNLVFLPHGALAAVELEAGRYWFRIDRHVSDGPSGEFRIRLIEGWHAEDPRLGE